MMMMSFGNNVIQDYHGNDITQYAEDMSTFGDHLKTVEIPDVEGKMNVMTLNELIQIQEDKEKKDDDLIALLSKIKNIANVFEKENKSNKFTQTTIKRINKQLSRE